MKTKFRPGDVIRSNLALENSYKNTWIIINIEGNICLLISHPNNKYFNESYEVRFSLIRKRYCVIK